MNQKICFVLLKIAIQLKLSRYMNKVSSFFHAVVARIFENSFMKQGQHSEYTDAKI